MTEREIAAAFKVTVAAVRKWGLAQIGTRKGSKLYDIRDAISYRFQETTAEAATLAESQKMTLDKRRELLQIQIDERNGKVARIEEVRQKWGDRLMHFRNSLDDSPPRAARDICAAFGISDQVKIEEILGKHIDEAKLKLVEYTEA